MRQVGLKSRAKLDSAGAREKTRATKMADEPGHVAEASATAETAAPVAPAGVAWKRSPDPGRRPGGSRRPVLPLNSRRLTDS